MFLKKQSLSQEPNEIMNGSPTLQFTAQEHGLPPFCTAGVKIIFGSVGTDAFWNGTEDSLSVSIITTISYALCVIITIIIITTIGLWDEHHHHNFMDYASPSVNDFMLHHHYQIMVWASTSLCFIFFIILLLFPPQWLIVFLLKYLRNCSVLAMVIWNSFLKFQISSYPEK